MCDECKDKGRVAYNQRQRDSRAARPKLPRERICTRCEEPYMYTPKRGHNKGVCGPCVPKLAAEAREIRLEKRRQRQRARYADLSQDERRVARFIERMNRFELEIPELDIITCGVCNSGDPGYSFWHIDHDHRCCPPSQVCTECFRGLLCGNCNTGLGMFKDDPDRLRRAAAWVSR